MLGRPIADVTIQDLDKLIEDKVPEGHLLEYKKAVPVSREQQREQLKADGGVEPFDKAVAAGTGIGDYGRNQIIEELVGFANSAGGTIILGISETSEKPPRAKKVCPIPHIIALENRLRSQILDQVEPRIPGVALKSVVTNDEGGGALLIETQPSILGPHWVRSSRSATIRREDVNAPLNMLEIHDMVLRNSRRFDQLSENFEKAAKEFQARLMRRFPWVSVHSDDERNAVAYLEGIERAAYGIRITIIAHQRLGLSRLEDFRSLGRIGWLAFDGEKTDYDHNFKPQAPGRRVLGGIESETKSQTMSWFYRLLRDGIIELDFVLIAPEPCKLHEAYFAATVANALSLFDALRQLAGAPDMPGDLEAEILSLRTVLPEAGSSNSLHDADRLPYRSLFPRTTVTDRASFNLALQELCNDLLNAGNLKSKNQNYTVGFPQID